MALVLDTGPVLASFDREDPRHVDCRTLLDQTRETLIIPSPVVVELDYWILERFHSGLELAFLNDIISGFYRVEDLTTEDYVRVRRICEQYADMAVGFVDAAVLAIVERLNESKLATLDHRHFGAMQPRHVDSLDLLPA